MAAEFDGVTSRPGILCGVSLRWAAAPGVVGLPDRSASGQKTPQIQNSLQREVKPNGEDVLVAQPRPTAGSILAEAVKKQFTESSLMRPSPPSRS